MKPQNRLKPIIFLFAVFASVSGWAQCSLNDVLLTTQTEVDNFAVDWPVCTEVTGNLTIHVQSSTDLITDLTPLSNLLVVQNEIRIFTDFDFDEPLLLNGLENISEAGGLVIGIPALTPMPELRIGSLVPLGGITGSLDKFSCSNATIDDMGTFQNITSIKSLSFTSCPSITALPEFPSLTYLGNMQIHSTGMDTLEIPPSISTFSTVDGQAPASGELSGLYVLSNSSLETIICESSFDQIFEIHIADNPNLSQISGFESLLSADKRLEIKGSRTNIFNAFHNLQNARRLILELIPAPGIIATTWNIRIGQNAPEFIVGSDYDIDETPRLYIRSNHIYYLYFHANLTHVQGDFSLIGYLMAQVTGFDNLASVDRNFYLDLRAINQLPDFTGLTHIGRDFDLQWEWVSFENLIGLDNLQYVGRNCTLGSSGTLLDTFFQSLVGLENLKHVGNNLTIGALPYLNNIHAVTDIEEIGGVLEIQSLPKLNSNYIVFSNLETVGGINLELLVMNTLPSFPLLTAIYGNFSFLNNYNVYTISGFPNLQEVDYIRFQQNTNLTQINCNSELVANSFRLSNNSALQACNSPCICQIMEHTTSNYIMFNGTTCGTASDILAACVVLGTDDPNTINDIKTWIDDSGRLIIQSRQNILKGSLEIYDISGRLIMQKKLVGNDLYDTTPFPNAASGIYFVDIRTDAGRFSQKIFCGK